MPCRVEGCQIAARKRGDEGVSAHGARRKFHFLIGGIGAANILDVKEAGADGASVISAIMGSRDPRRAASALIAAWRQP